VVAYAGTIHFTSTDALATLPANAPISGGAGTFPATLRTGGNQKITATDTVTPSLTGTTANISVPASAAIHFVFIGVGNPVAGTQFSVEISAHDAQENAVATYAGTVKFTSTDPQATLPASVTFSGGSAFAQFTLRTAGIESVTAVDSANASITGVASVSVKSAPANRLVVQAPGTVTAGHALSFAVTARDAFNNVATDYLGTVKFSSSDSAAVLPANSVLTNGTANFSATLKTQSVRTLVATDAALASLTGSITISVLPGSATHFSLGTPITVIPGTGISFSVTAQDEFDNTAFSYSGTLVVSCTDPQAIIEQGPTITNGFGRAGVTVRTPGVQTVTVADSVNPTLTGSVVVGVSSPAAATIGFRGLSDTVAGSPATAQVVAFDASNNVATSYTGTVKLTSTDGVASLPTTLTFTAGTAALTFTPRTAGTQSITFTDSVKPALTGTLRFTVKTARASRFNLSAPSAATAGAAFSFTVTARDPYNNIVPDYAGNVRFTSTDTAAVLPPPSTLTNGAGVFNATLKSSGGQSIMASDAANPAVAGSADIQVPNPISTALPTKIGFLGLTAATAGTAASIQVLAYDATGAVAGAYSGTVKLTITDGAATMPATLALNAGAAFLSFTPRTAGSQSLTATDAANSALTGTVTFLVKAAPASRFDVSAPSAATSGAAFNFTVTARDPYNNTAADYSGTVRLTSSDAAAILPQPGNLTNGTAAFSATMKSAGAQTISAVDSADSSVAGSSATITVTATAPLISIAAVVNGASFATGAAAPNTLMSLYGTNPCADGVVVLVDGSAADLFFANNTQINFLVPARVSGKSAVPLVIACGSTVSAAFTLQVAPAAPAIFTALASGSGQAANVNQDGSVETPAPAGSIVALFTTGFGLLKAPDSDGLSRVALPVTVFVGEVPATVVYAGEAPGYTRGLQQIDFVIPQNAPSGAAVPVRLVVGGISTQTGVTLAIP
jgi:uncharacterized protein (TIGR03437 family)